MMTEPHLVKMHGYLHTDNEDLDITSGLDFLFRNRRISDGPAADFHLRHRHLKDGDDFDFPMTIYYELAKSKVSGSEVVVGIVSPDHDKYNGDLNLIAHFSDGSQGAIAFGEFKIGTHDWPSTARKNITMVTK